MVSNAPKLYGTQQNVSLVSYKVDRVHSLPKILTRVRGTNFCTSLSPFALSFVRQPNGPECTQIVQNATKHQFRVQWGGQGAFVTKNSDATSWHELLHQFGPFCTEFSKATKRSQMHPNSTKHTKTSVQRPMGWIGCVRSKKFRRDFVARTFVLIAPFRPILRQVSRSNKMVLKHTQIVRNALKHEFRAQWGGSGAFVAKKFDATS